MVSSVPLPRWPPDREGNGARLGRDTARQVVSLLNRDVVERLGVLAINLLLALELIEAAGKVVHDLGRQVAPAVVGHQVAKPYASSA